MNINDVRNYFYNLHDVECNQKYYKTLPYSFHLGAVVLTAEKFKECVHDRQALSKPSNSFSRSTIWDEIVIGCLGHDSIEDARITYNELLELFGSIAAEIIYLCTENRGRNRADRKNDVWYNELVKNKHAVFVKLCDIIANVTFGILTNSSMVAKYKAEYNQKVKPLLYIEEYKPMFDHLEALFNLK